MFVEALEERRMLSWGSIPQLIGQDVAVADYPAINGAGEVIAVIDSGWDFSNAQLSGHLWTNPNPNDMAGFPNDVHGWNFYANNNNVADLVSHGSQVSAIISGSQFTYGGAQYQGIAPGAKILPLEAWGSVSGQPSVAFDENVGKALTYLVDLIEAHPSYNIVALNLSIHAYDQASYIANEQPQILELEKLGVYIAAASGNDASTTSVSYPAAEAGVNAIGGVYGDGASVDTVTPQTNRSSKIALLAPSIDTPIIDYGAVGITTIGPAGDGTSYSTPYVTGAAALIKEINPNFMPAQITQILQQSGQDVYDPASGLTFKRVNLGAALAMAYATTPADVPFLGPASSLPGVLQAENFDNGGQSIAYNNPSRGDATGLYRNTTMSIQRCNDRRRGYEVANTKAGEWMNYSVNVASAGSYSLSARMANAVAGARFHIELDGVNVTGEMTVPDTGSYTSWATVSKSGIVLAAGNHTLRFVFDRNAGRRGYGGDLNWISVTAS